MIAWQFRDCQAVESREPRSNLMMLLAALCRADEGDGIKIALDSKTKKLRLVIESLHLSLVRLT